MTRKNYRFGLWAVLPLAFGLLGGAVVAARPATAQEMPLTIGSGKAQTETREIGSVRQVKVDGAAKLTVTEGDTESLTVEADDNLLPLIRSDVRGGVLHLGVRSPYRVETKKEIRFRLQVKRGSVERIELSGAVNGEVDTWSADRPTLDVSGAARITVDQLYARTLFAQISGASQVRIARGTVGEQRTLVSGAARYDAGGLKTTRTQVQASGASKILVRAEDLLNIVASGATVIEYNGKPEVRQELSGACTVRRKD